jgi:hypothetical protein
VRRVFFLLNAAFAMAILALISRVHLASFVIILPKYYTCIEAHKIKISWSKYSGEGKGRETEWEFKSEGFVREERLRNTGIKHAYLYQFLLNAAIHFSGILKAVPADSWECN